MEYGAEHDTSFESNESKATTAVSGPTPPPSARRGRRQIWLAGAVAVAAFGLASAVGIIWWHGTAEYALKQIYRSISTHDRELFYEFVDVDSVVSRATDDVIAVKMEQEQEDSSGIANKIAMGVVALMKPRMVEAAKSQLDRMIDSDDITAAPKAGDDRNRVGELMTKLQSAGRLVETRKLGKVTVAALEFEHTKYGVKILVALKMRKVDGHLQVFEIGDLKQAITTIDAAELNWKKEQNAPLHAEIDKKLLVEQLFLSTRTSEWGYEHTATFTVKVLNQGSQPIEAWDCQVEVKNPNGSRAFVLPVHARGQHILPGQEGTVVISRSINQFIDEDKLIWGFNLNGATIANVTTALRDASGTIIVPYPAALNFKEEK